MWACYLIVIIPALVGAVLWVKRKEVVWWEWLLSPLVGIVTVVVFQFISVQALTADTETWSGKVIQVIHYPRWEARWTTTETHTDSKGHSHTRTVHHHETHSQYWAALDTLEEERSIPVGDYNDWKAKLGGIIRKEKPHKTHFDSGDPYTYHTDNSTGYVIPCTTTKSFENRVKCSKSLFSFIEVPKSVPVFKYPVNQKYVSSRVLGGAPIPILAWDQTNARLGPIMKVNLILVAFKSDDSMMGQYQEAAWLRGKKNDLVICYGGDSDKPSWVYCFGWTEKDLVKRNLETIILEKGVSLKSLPDIENEVITNYRIKDWKKFNYLTIEIPWYYYLILVIIMVASQVGYWSWAYRNDRKKEGNVYTYLGTVFRRR